jgi:hypothetical protein
VLIAVPCAKRVRVGEIETVMVVIYAWRRRSRGATGRKSWGRRVSVKGDRVLLLGDAFGCSTKQIGKQDRRAAEGEGEFVTGTWQGAAIVAGSCSRSR